MMKSYLTNSFSINMIEEQNDTTNVIFEKITPDQIPADAESQIGHDDMRQYLEEVLHRKVEKSRANCKLAPDTVIYVAQYIGPRLPEGAIHLPEGAKVIFYKVYLAD